LREVVALERLLFEESHCLREVGVEPSPRCLNYPAKHLLGLTGDFFVYNADVDFFSGFGRFFLS